MRRWLFTLCIFALLEGGAAWSAEAAPHPVQNPQSSQMLIGDWVPADPHKIDFKSLPVVASEHGVVSDVRDAGGTRVHQHNYLAHFDGKFWMMWSDGPGDPIKNLTPRQHREVTPRHDLAGQRVSFATSDDGIKWSKVQDLAGEPKQGFGWIARGFWVREGKLLALVTLYKAPGYANPGLALRAYEMEKNDAGQPTWRPLGVVMDDAMNNFAPKQIGDGQWLMSRRDHRRNVHFLRGGVAALDQWESFPLIDYRGQPLEAEEPYWWILPDGNLLALFRDNKGGGYLYRAFSTDDGRTWTKPVRTNFPDATSKFSGLRLQDGRYVLVSNANPRARNPLTLAVSDDGIVFNRLGSLVGGRHVDYPHVIEQDGHLYVAFAGAKQTVEVLKIDLAELDKIDNRATPANR